MKYFINLLTIFTVTFVIVLAAPSRAEAGFAFPDYLSMWFPQWFGEPEEGPDPSETLQVPFEDPSKVPANPGEAIGVPHSYDGQASPGDLSVPHRNHTQVGQWLVRAIAEVMTLEPDPTLLKVHFNRLETGMNDFAIEAFKNFLSANQVLALLRNRDMRLNSIVNGTPLLLNEGPVEGRYRWLFQVPVTMTYVPVGENASAPDVVHQDATLIIQVGRVKGGVQGKVMETWQLKEIGERTYPNRDSQN